MTLKKLTPKITTLLILCIAVCFINLMFNHFSFTNILSFHKTNGLIWVTYGLLIFIYFLIQQIYGKQHQLNSLITKINQFENNLEQYHGFIKQLEQGNYISDYKTLEHDKIGQLLTHLKNQLQKNKEIDEQRKKEELQRNWVAEGLAGFNDILRTQKDDDLHETAYTVISNLVSYLKANQGGFFLLKTDEHNTTSENRYFEPIAAYAYDRRKLLEKHIKWGEGLVGSCAFEKKSIYLTDVPQNYINITSGLGDARPNALLLVPLKLEDEIFGVIELASFNEIPQYQQDFVLKIGETLASTLSSIKIKIQTTELLEQTQKQAEELSAQEEELRQNLEEMQATQESLEQSQAKTQMIFENVMDAIVTIDERGNIDQFSPSAEKLFGYQAAEVSGQNIKILMPVEYSQHHDGYINNYLHTGHRKILGASREAKAKTKEGKVFPIDLRVEETVLYGKRMFVGTIRDITDIKTSQEEVLQQLEEIRSQDEELRQNIEELQTTQEMIEEREAKIRMIFDNAMDAIITINSRGNIDQFNAAAEQMFGYEAQEVINKNVAILLPEHLAPEHSANIENYLNTGEKHILGATREEFGKRKDDSIFPIEIRVQEASLAGKTMFVGMLRDITDKKHAENEIKQQVIQLQQKEQELSNTLNALNISKEALMLKDKNQRKEIKKLNEENQQKINRIEHIMLTQIEKDRKIKALYEGEINQMFDTWMHHLDFFEKFKNN